MKKVESKIKLKWFFGFFATLALALGVGVSLEQSKGTMPVKAAEPTTITVTRDDFSGGTGYAEGTWTKGGIGGVGFIYFTTTGNIQVSTNAGRRPYPYNTTATPGPITSISVTMPGTGSLRDLTPRVSATAAVTTETSGTALALKTFTSNTQTLSWEIPLNDNIRYFQLVPGGNTNWANFSFTYQEVEELEFETLTSLELDDSNVKKEFFTTETFNIEDLVVIAKDQNGTTKFVELADVTTNFDGVVFDEDDIGVQEVEVTYEEGLIEVSDTYEIEVFEMPDYAMFTKITSSAQLVLGASYVVAGAKGDPEVVWVMSTTQGNNNRTAIEAQMFNDEIKETENTQTFTLEEGTVAGSFAFKAINGDTAGQYIYSAGGTTGNNNYLKSQTTKDANGSWKMTFTGGVLTEVKSQGNAQRNVLRLNSASALFSSYADGQTPVSLYVDESTLPAPALVTSFTVEPQFEGPIFTTSALQSSDFAVNVVKDGKPGSSSDYTVEIGRLEETVFASRTTVEWGVTKPVVADNLIRFKSIHPQTPGASDHLTVDIAISVIEPSLSSISITGSMTKTNYFTTDAWSAVGLTVTALFDNGDELNVTNNVTWSYNPTNPNNVSTTSVIVTATYQGEEDSKTISGITITEKSMTPLVVSEIYGAGGNVGATLKNDFVELYNNTDSAMSLDGLSIQQASASGTTWAVKALSGSILAKSYYLVTLAGGSNGVALPTADDATNTQINLSGTDFKIALVDGTTALAGTQSTISENVLDFVGAGTANAYEGTGAAPKPSTTTSISRTIVNGIAVDTDVNTNDFTAGAPTPMNSALGVAEKIMAYPSVSGGATECAEKYNTIKPLILSLSAGQKGFFQTDTRELVQNARERYLSWAAANRDSTPYEDGSSGGNINFFNDKNNMITFVILISILGVSTLAGFYFIRKRPKEEEVN